MSRHRGFTLMELLVVIGIIALLAALIIPAIFAARAHSKSRVSQAELNDFCVAVKAWETDHAAWPPQEPGYGITTAGLITVMETPGPIGRCYYAFKPETVDAGVWKNELGFPFRYRTDATSPLWHAGTFNAWSKGRGDDLAGDDSMPETACSINNR